MAPSAVIQYFRYFKGSASLAIANGPLLEQAPAMAAILQTFAAQARIVEVDEIESGMNYDKRLERLEQAMFSETENRIVVYLQDDEDAAKIAEAKRAHGLAENDSGN